MFLWDFLGNEKLLVLRNRIHHPQFWGDMITFWLFYGLRLQHHSCLTGKSYVVSSLNGPFSIAMLNNQRVASMLALRNRIHHPQVYHKWML